MVRRGDRDGIDRMSIQQFPDISMGLNLHAFALPLLSLTIKDALIDITEAGDAHAFELVQPAEVIASAAIEANDTHAYLVTGAELRGNARERETQSGGGGGGGFEKFSAIDSFHRIDCCNF
jgi:hypothetical protein